MRDPNDYPNRWNLQHEFLKIFNDALEISSPYERPVILSLDKKEFGDYFCNNVLSIWYKKKPETMPLKHIAEAIKNNIPSNDMMEDCRIQSGGFLTFKLSRIWIAKSIHKMLRDGIHTWAPILYMERAIIDFSFRNISEEMDVDHFRSTIIGDTLLRMLEFGEVDVILKNQIGNRHSTRYGMLIQYLMESSQNGQTNGEFEVFYKESKKRFDEDDEFREKAHQALTCLQIGVRRFVNAWAKICEMERKMYQKVYTRLGVRMEQRVKRFYSPYIHGTLDILRQEGLTEKSERDEVIFVEEKLQHESIERKKKPLTIVKKTGDYDNALTYLTSLRHQLKDEKPELIINVADVGKKKYIEMCIAAARRARWLPTDEKRYPLTKFVGYGLVQDDDLNRAGKLADLLENAKTRCKAALVERVKADEWTAKELEDTAEALGYGAVKYAQLKDFRVFKYTFDFDEMLNDKGNTGVYLLYKHAQICSIINKSGKDIEELKKTRKLLLEKDEERELGLHLIQFTETLEFACTRFLPDHVCKYLYELSEKFNCFYSIVCQAVGDVDEEANKLLVCEATRVVMTKCFHLLGITPIDKISICISEKMTMPPPVKGDDEDVIESFSNNEDKEETVSSSSSGEDKEDIVSSSSGDEKTPAKRFKSSDLSLEEEEEKEPLKYLTPRFQLFSALVVVDNYCSVQKPCLLFGSISVSDLSVSSEKDGWVATDEPDFGYVDLFYRNWYEPLPIINNGYIRTLSLPRSVPVIDFLDIQLDLYVLGLEDDMFFQVSDKYTHFSLSDLIYDHFSSHIARGPDGLVKLSYIVLSHPVEAALELITQPADYDVFEKPLSVKVYAYYGGDYDCGCNSQGKGYYNITLLEDDYFTMSDKSKIRLNTSVLAVPAKGSLVIDTLIKDSNEKVIMKKIFDFPAKRKGSSNACFEESGCSFELIVNWKC